MYVDEKKLEGKKNASSDVITSSLCLSRDTQSTMEESCFQQKFSEKRTTSYYSAPTLTGKKKSSKLVCSPEEVR